MNDFDTDQLGFFELANGYDAFSKQGDLLAGLAHHISLARFRSSLEKILWRSKRQKGWAPFDAIMMLKVLLVQPLYQFVQCPT